MKNYENPNYDYDPSDLNWLKYRTLISGGDPNYLENVFKYIENVPSVISLQHSANGIHPRECYYRPLRFLHLQR